MWGGEGQRGLSRAAELLRGRAGLRSQPLVLETGFLSTDAVWTPSFFLGVWGALLGYFLLCAWLPVVWAENNWEMIHLDSSLLESTPRSRAFQWCNKSVHIWTGLSSLARTKFTESRGSHPSRLEGPLSSAAPHREETGSPCLFLELQGHYDMTYLAGHL